MRLAPLLFIAGIGNLVAAAFGLGCWLLRPSIRASLRFWTIPAIAVLGGLFFAGPAIMSRLASSPWFGPKIQAFLADEWGGLAVFGAAVLAIQSILVESMKAQQAEYRERMRKAKIAAISGP